MEITVEVNEDDIRDGRQQDCYGCPIALAVGRLFPDGYKSVSRNHVYLWPTVSSDKLTASLPEEAKQFISSFDNDGDVEPFTFKLNLS